MIHLPLEIPQPDKHKGQNGRLLIVGGSTLFHAASLWSAQIAAHLVDMVFYASTVGNNDLLKFAKSNFGDGIIIDRQDICSYAAQADVILVGPGMMRTPEQPTRLVEILAEINGNLTLDEWQNQTYLIVNFLLARFPDKKFVIDAGALQMLDLSYLNSNCILTPHAVEAQQLFDKADTSDKKSRLDQAWILSKHRLDQILHQGQVVAEVTGGNAGLTKGGSGDVLAGLTAGLYCYNEPAVAAWWASRALKAAATELFAHTGPFFTTSQLVTQIPSSLWKLLHD